MGCSKYHPLLQLHPSEGLQKIRFPPPLYSVLHEGRFECPGQSGTDLRRRVLPAVVCRFFENHSRLSIVKMNGTRPPLTSTNASARAAVKRAKAGSAFTLDNSDFSLHLLVWFYIAARNLGTTAPKISVFSSVLKGKKFSILKAFHGATAFCGANANTISYNITFVNLRVRAYLPSRHSKPFSERKLISSRKANCRTKELLQKCNKHALRSDG